MFVLQTSQGVLRLAVSGTFHVYGPGDGRFACGPLNLPVVAHFKPRTGGSKSANVLVAIELEE